MQSICREKEIPTTDPFDNIAEEDVPLDVVPNGEQPIEAVRVQMELNEQKHSHEVDNSKIVIGKSLLYASLIAIVLLAVADAIFNISSQMYTNAFDVAKYVATTVLGFLFGSRTQK